MSARLLLPLVAFVGGCGFYTYEEECNPKPDEGHEVDGDLVAIQSRASAKDRLVDPLPDTPVVIDEDGTARIVSRPQNDFDANGVVVKLGGVVFSFDRPAVARPFRLEDLHARACTSYAEGECTSPKGTVDVSNVGPDSLDLVVRIDDEPIGEGPVVRGSTRLVFKRWEHQVCVTERKGSDSAFAIKY